ncbi:MAG: thiolase family protein [Actinomycetia bacterium]|nr:thiolase family protein [Actinomycetes bacterium]MCP4962762.1 thiolase family protein [Actinomycetes bacterium]
MTRDVFLIEGLRSPIGRFGGSLLPLRATEFGSTVAEALLDRINLDKEAVELVVGGMVLQDMTESNPARIVSQRIGLPDRVPAFTLNMQCCSGMASLIQATYQVASGAVDLAMVMGIESMSNAPHMVPGSRWGHRLGSGAFLDTLRECTLAGSGMWGDPKYMIDVAENHAQVDGFSREQMDAYAIVSHDRAIAAIEAGNLDDEIVPIEYEGRKGVTRFERDENPRSSTLDSLARLPTVKDGGAITAGNAASINDGAAVAVIASASAMNRYNLEPLARIVTEGMAMVGCDPNLMGYSCVDALNAALGSADKTVDDLDLIECNEGFAVQLIACEEMGGWSRDRLNVDGGSVALGHPVGMSGLRITIHLAKALRQRGLTMGGATVPAGSGLGTAVLLEVV